MTDEERKAKRRALNAAWNAKNPGYKKAWAQANPDKIREACRKYYASDPAAGRARSAKWCAENPERVKARDRTRDPDVKRASNRAWRKANPEKASEQAKTAKHRRRARKLAVGGEISAADLRSICEMADGICAYCLKPCDEMHLEHCIPLVRGGANAPDNCVMACPSCNARKGAKTPLEFLCGLPKLGVAA